MQFISFPNRNGQNNNEANDGHCSPELCLSDAGERNQGNNTKDCGRRSEEMYRRSTTAVMVTLFYPINEDGPQHQRIHATFYMVYMNEYILLHEIVLGRVGGFFCLF